jgi:hypothetical protein
MKLLEMATILSDLVGEEGPLYYYALYSEI